MPYSFEKDRDVVYVDGICANCGKQIVKNTGNIGAHRQLHFAFKHVDPVVPDMPWLCSERYNVELPGHLQVATPK